jgi:hypothetical protein
VRILAAPVRAVLAVILAASLFGAAAPVGRTTAAFVAQTASAGNSFTNLVVAATAQPSAASAAGGTVTLTWTASPTGSVTYTIARRLSGSGSYAVVASGLTGLSHAETPPADGLYDYVVRAAVSSFTADSPARTAVSDRTAPTAATGLAGATGSLTGTVSLSWTAATDATSGVAGYNVYSQQTKNCNTGTYSLWGSVGAVSSATITGLLGNKDYCFYVVTRDAVGNLSANSVTAGAKSK